MNKSFSAETKRPTGGYAADNYLQHWLQDDAKRAQDRKFATALEVLRQYKWSVLLLFILGCLAGALKAVNEDPIYRSQLTMLVEPANARAVNQPIVFNPYGFRFYETQYEMLRSRTVATRVVENLRLVDRAGLSQILLPPTFFTKLKQSLARMPFLDRVIVADDISTERLDQVAISEADRLRKSQWLVGMIQGGVRVVGANKSQLVQVSFDSRDPKFAAEIANALVDAYINNGLESQLSRSEQTSSWLVERLEQVRENLTEAELSLQDYLVNKGSVDLQRTREISSQQLSALNQDYLSARSQYDDLSKRYGGKHPRLAAARSELYSAKARYDAASKGIGGNKQQEFELAKLERDIEVNQQLYDLFLKKFRETDLSTGEQLSSARVVDKALPPSGPIYPNKQRIMLLWGLGGLVLGIVLAYLRDQLDTTFKNPEQIEKALQLPLIGVVPRSDKDIGVESEREYLHDMRSPFAESINHIRTGVTYSHVDNPPQIVMVTSALQGEGKTTTSSNLALAYAQLGKTLLIDADLRRPRIKSVTNTHSEQGLVDYVAGAANLAECLVEDNDCSTLDILNCGTPPPNPLDLLASEKMRMALDELRGQYEHIIIDTAPILPASDAIVLGRLVDAILMVIRAEETKGHLAKDAIRRLQGSHVEPTGLILAQANFQRINSYRYGGYYTPDYQR